MSNLRLCVGKRAQTPFYLNNVCMNITSIEELCYLVALNPFMITQEIMTKDLVEWIDLECELPELASMLRPLFERGSRLGEFIDLILDYVNYCDDEERMVIDETLKSNSGLNNLERKKRQADYLLRNERFETAIEEYEGLLNLLPDVESAMKIGIYHNMGYAYARLFMFDVAAKFLRRSFDMSKDPEVALQFLMAMRMYLSENKYLNFIAEHQEFKEYSLELEKKMNVVLGEFEGSQESLMLSTLNIYKDEGNVASYYEEIDKVIAEMKDDYLKQVAD